VSSTITLLGAAFLVGWLAADVLIFLRRRADLRRESARFASSPLARVVCPSCGGSALIHSATCRGSK
jgi:hypothetical protein